MKNQSIESETFVGIKTWVSSNRIFLIAIGLILAAFTTISLYASSAPGLYMDAINPDYEVVKIFNPDAPVTVWEAPGDLIFQRFPVMFELYAGSFITYWSIPFYGLLGHDILSVRVAHLSAGLVLLCCIAVLVRQLTRSNLIAAILCAIVALDPTFIFALRTQAYVVIFPIIFITLALLLLNRSVKTRSILTAGILLGLAAFGYFVYLFAIPGVLLYIVTGKSEKRIKTALTLCLGIAVGLIPYAIAFGLLFANLGIAGGLAWIHSALGGLHVVPTDDSYGARIASILTQSRAVLANQWLQGTFWQDPHDDTGQSIKAFLIVFIPLLGFAARSNSDRAKASFMLVALPALSFVIFATYFGPRLGGHDLSSVLTFAYLTSAVAIAFFFSSFPTFRRQLGFVFGFVAIAIFVSNLAATASVAAKLDHDSGSGLYSSIISKIPEDAQKQPGSAQTPYIFWSWGEMMPFIYETGGTIPAYAGDQLMPAICKYGGANVVFLSDDATRIPAAFPAHDLTISNDALLHDPSSGLPYRVLFAKSAHPDANCAKAIAASAPITSEQQTQRVERASSLSTPPSVIGEASTLALAAPIESEQYPAGVLKGSQPMNRIGGIYPVAHGEEKCCWVSKDVQFSIADASQKSAVVVEIYVPSIQPWSDDPGTVSSIGFVQEIIDTKTLKPGLQSVVLKTDVRALKNGVQTVKIRFSQEANPKKLGLNGDERNLSAILVSVSPE